MKRLRKITRVEKFEMMIGKVVLTLIGGIIGTAIFFGIMYLVGWLVKAINTDYKDLLFLVIKNELRGPKKGCSERICTVIKDAKEKENLQEVSLELTQKANHLLYFIWKHPGKISVTMGRIAIGIFDRRA